MSWIWHRGTGIHPVQPGFRKEGNDSLENSLIRATSWWVFKLSLVSSVIPPGGWVDKQSLVWGLWFLVDLLWLWYKHAPRKPGKVSFWKLDLGNQFWDRSVPLQPKKNETNRPINFSLQSSQCRLKSWAPSLTSLLGRFVGFGCLLVCRLLFGLVHLTFHEIETSHFVWPTMHQKSRLKNVPVVLTKKNLTQK